LIRAPLLNAIVGISHRVLSYRSVVRDGIGASTPVPSRLYSDFGAMPTENR
jgi:hypothetical protein